MSSSNPQPGLSPRKFFPGWPGRIIVAISLLGLAAVQALGRLEYPPAPFNDPAWRNVATLVLSFVAVFTVWLWFCFFSGFASRTRRLALGVSVLLVVGLVVLFRFVEVTGDMRPRFEPRWLVAHDRRLGRLERHPAAREIDLKTTTGDDFPQFLGPQRNGWLAGPELARNWSAAPPKLLWKREIGAGWSAFSAVNGYAVTLEQRGDEEWVACYEIATGNPMWGHSIRARHENPMGGVGPRSTPTIHGGRVYALGATGVLRCLDGATGALIWQDDLLRRYGLTQEEDEQLVQWGRSGSPLIVDELVVVPGGGPAGKAKNLVAFHAQTGKLVWESQNAKPDGSADHISYASPALVTLAGRRQIVIVNESTVSGHDPARGERLWSHPWPGSSSSTASASQAAPIGENWLLLSKGYSGGAELVELLASGADGSLHTRTRWKDSRLLQTKFTNVVVYGGHIYGLSEGILECVEAASGKRKWKSSRGRYGHGQILGVGDLILVLAEDGRLALVEASPHRFAELGSFQALEGKTWNNLCLSGKKLLLRNGQQAACYELP